MGNCNNYTPPTTEVRTIESSGDDGFLIPVKIWRPHTPRAAVFFIHGGIFANGSRESHPGVSAGLASLNLAVITASFRNGTDAPFATGTTERDLADVVRYFRKMNPDVPFGLVGSSSGGYFALSLCRTLGAKAVDFCVPICPVAHPGRRATYLRSCIAGTAREDGYGDAFHIEEKARRILDTQMGFWVEDAASENAGEALRTPSSVPTLLVLGSVDRNVPFRVTSDVQGWATRTVVVGGAGHEINDAVPPGYRSYLPDIDKFVEHIMKFNSLKPK